MTTSTVGEATVLSLAGVGETAGFDDTTVLVLSRHRGTANGGDGTTR